ncbi:MAG: FAD-dependent oxidoreductase [Candidatus Hadarchaeales archaeon]
MRVEREVELVVVGGGAAGLAAALKAREEGIEEIWVLDRNERPGGILPQCIHTGFGLHYFGENLTGPEYIHRFIRRAREEGITIKLETMVLRLTKEREVVAVNPSEGLLKLKAGAVILAMGCRERPRGSLLIPGGRPAGIFTAGTAQRLLDLEGYLPGREVVILGSGDVGLIMARRFAMEGVEVKAVVELMPYPGGLGRNVVQCLEDFGIPLLLRRTVTHIHGRERVEAVTVAEVDGEGNPIPGTERKIPCDTLILSVGLIPENELSEGAGIELDERTGGPFVDEFMRTSLEGFFACGNVVTVFDLVDHVTLTGERAGKSASQYLKGELPPPRRVREVRPGENVRLVVPQRVSGEGPVTFYLRVSRPLREARVEVGGKSFFRKAVRPPEMLTVELGKEEVKGLGGEIPVRVLGKPLG